MVSASAKHHFRNTKNAEALDAQVWRQILPEVLTQARSLKIIDLRQLHDEGNGVLGSHTGLFRNSLLPALVDSF